MWNVDSNKRGNFMTRNEKKRYIGVTEVIIQKRGQRDYVTAH